MVWREADARDPVSVSFILDCVLALGQSIPQFNGLVPGTGHDLTVVSGESDGEDVLGMVFEPTSGLSGSQIPKSQGLAPGARQGVVSVG